MTEAKIHTLNASNSPQFRTLQKQNILASETASIEEFQSIADNKKSDFCTQYALFKGKGGGGHETKPSSEARSNQLKNMLGPDLYFRGQVTSSENETRPSIAQQTVSERNQTNLMAQRK